MSTATTKRPGTAPAAARTDDAPPAYQSGFGNEFATEALPGALPVGQNSPQRAPYGLYAEQISGTAFTAPRGANRRTWTYRIRPSAMHEPFRRVGNGRVVSAFGDVATPPNQLRWDPLPPPDAPTDFVDGLVTMAGNGDPAAMAGCAIHLYAANRSMTDRFFYDADGELLIVPQQGRLRIATELGRLDVAPLEIAVIPRGIRFRVELPDANRTPGARLRLRELRRAAAAARPRRHRLERARESARLPDAARVVRGPRRRVRAGREVHGQPVVGGDRPFAARRRRVARQLRRRTSTTSRRFNTIGSISYDHPDPSIFLVLQSQSDTPGVDTIDFVIFPPRILAMEHTFRPPWFHRNVASEFMGLIHGVYDAKAEGFLPGGASLHNCMTGHGPDAETFEKASTADLSQPTRIADTMAFMFETRQVIRPTRIRAGIGAAAARVLPLLAGTAPEVQPRSTLEVRMPAFETILVETRGRVGVIRLNRPQRMNALNDALAKELSVALHAFDDDAGVGCIVLTGNDNAFAAGADIGAMAEWDYAKVLADDYITRDWEEIRRIRKPVIAAVAGYALGGGCELAMACDTIVAADNAKFGQPEITIGTMPGMGGTQRLPRAIGKAKAMDWCLTGRMVDAAEAERAGLVARVVPADKLEEEALALATRIASFSLPVVLKIKEAINRAYESSLAEGLLFERREFHATFALDDQKEGMRAFVEKRKPGFAHR